jgi:hypothetical protein
MRTQGLDMATPELDKVYQMLNALCTEDKQKIAEFLTNPTNDLISQDAKEVSEAEAWEEGELEALLADNQPMSGKEIVEWGVQSGVFGSWSDRDDIQDGGEWIAEQRAKSKTTWQ